MIRLAIEVLPEDLEPIIASRAEGMRGEKDEMDFGRYAVGAIKKLYISSDPANWYK